MKKYSILALLLLAFSTTLFAQKQLQFYVLGFEEKPFDTAANDARYKIVDGNGDLFSIIKLRSESADDDLMAYKFDFGYCESRVKEVNGEVWLYVQRNAMRATIQRDGYKTVKYELDKTVQPGKVYEMVLSAEAQKVQKQMVLFTVNPADAQSTIMYKSNLPGAEESVLGIIDANGQLAENLPLGTYTYRVISKNYHTSDGLLILDNVDETREENVVLRPKFATITLNAEPGVEIRIDGESKGYGTWTGPLNAGTYNIECSKASYKPSTEVLKVEEGKNETVTLKALTPILGALSVKSSPLGARISIDGTDYGKTPKNVNKLLIGTHNVVLTLDGYESVEKTVNVVEGTTEDLNVKLNKLPEGGNIYVTTSPSGAQISVGGVDYGKSPCTIKNLKAGTYVVQAKKDGYYNASYSVTVEAGVTSNADLTLYSSTPSSSSSSSSSSYSSSYSSKKNYSYSSSRSSNWKQYFNLGITGTLGGMWEDETSDIEDAFHGDIGLLFRMGSPSKNWFNFIIGAKFGYMMIGYDDWTGMTFPMTLNWNMYRDSDGGIYLGLGVEPGFDVYDYGFGASVGYLAGYASRHHDFNFFLKLLMTDENEGLSMGCAYTYYF